VAAFRPADPALLDARARAEAGAAAAAAEAAVGRARAEVQRARAALTLARSDLERDRELAREQLVAPDALEARETAFREAQEAVRAAEFTLRAAEHERAMARARVAPPSGGGREIVIRAPVDGLVLRRIRESESVVAAGEPLLEIGDPKDLEVVSDLLSTDAVKVQPGSPVLIDEWGGDRVLQGRVRLVEPSGFMKLSALGVEEQRVNVIIDLADPAAAGQVLGDGYRVEVRIVIWQAPAVVKVPVSALLRRGEDWAVFVVEGGRARLRTVTVGHRNAREAEVVTGVAPGQRVVVHPSDRVQDGARVTTWTPRA
jgi:HlyD family secretion protein